MSQDVDPRYDESFNSFLAGVLLTRKKIDNYSFFQLMNKLQNEYDITIVSDATDIKLFLYFSDNDINMRNDYDDVIIINNKKMTVKEYLYSFTTPRVREFFGLNDDIYSEKKQESISIPLVKALKKTFTYMLK